VLAGLWRQHESFDGTYDFHDLVEVNRALDIRDENQRRAQRAAIEAAKNSK
jgi:hypothetical protein